MTGQIKDNEKLIEEYDTKKREALKRAEDLEHQIQNFNKEDQLTKTKNNIKATQKQLDKLNEKVKSVQQVQVRYSSELEQLQEEKNEADAEREQLIKTVADFNAEIQTKKKQVDRQVVFLFVL